MKKVLSIAGSDCSGGAGIQADLKTFSALGTFGMSVITSVVAENTSRVLAVSDVPPDMIAGQIAAVFEDIEVDAVKVGMLSTPGCMRAVAAGLQRYRPANIVIDPVMYAKNGDPLMEREAISLLTDMVIPLADVLTPNIPEAEQITGDRILSVRDMEEAARKIRELGCKAVIVKGGHSSQSALDVLFDGKRIWHFDAARIDTKNTHGTGCTFSSAIAALLAKGMNLQDAVRQAKAYVTMAIRHSLDIGKGYGPTHHFYHLYKYGLPENSGNCPAPDHRRGHKTDYSLYLVTDRLLMHTQTLAETVEQAVIGGCTLVQLREKDISAGDFLKLALEVKEITDRHNTPLIINDRVDIAMAVGAAGVHIGQSDLPAVMARRIIGPDKLLGVSVSCAGEAQAAADAGADYLGVGAMFPTQTKPDAPSVSMEELQKIRQAVSLPIVAIGGIREENADLFAPMGVNGLAVISAVISRPDIKQAAALMLECYKGQRPTDSV